MAASVVLVNPKFTENVAGAIRACACFGVETLRWTGQRVSLDGSNGKRIPREARMSAYRMVNLAHVERAQALTGPMVAVEIAQGFVPLQQFEHPVVLFHRHCQLGQHIAPHEIGGRAA